MNVREVLQAIEYEHFNNDYENAYVKLNSGVNE